MCPSRYISITFHHVNIHGRGITRRWRGVPDCPHPCSKRLESYFSHVEMGSLTQQVVVAPITYGPLQVEGTGESGGPPCKGYTDTSTFSSLCFPRQHCCWVSYPPYPSCFIVFSFPSGCWLAFGFVDCTLCTSDIWVGGTVNQRSGWSLSVVSTIVAIDLTTDQWTFLVLNQLYHRHVVQNFVWPCQGWTVAHLEKSHRVSQTESISVRAVALSLSPPPLKTLPKLQRPWITEVPKTSGTTPAGKRWDLYLNQTLLTPPFSDVI
jgi:hypothetical protein